MSADESSDRSRPADGPPGLPLAALEGHLREALPGLLHGPLFAQLVAGGRSNLTYLLTDGRDRWVLRRPPLGHVLETAHDPPDATGRDRLMGEAPGVPVQHLRCRRQSRPLPAERGDAGDRWGHSPTGTAELGSRWSA